MYIPTAFREDRLDVILDAIRRTGLATLTTFGPDGLLATPLPLMHDPDPAPYGTLWGHLARANPQWQRSDPAIEGLAAFAGPDAYISPGWYATKRETGRVVPTWNYVAIHAYGIVEFFEDTERLRALVSRLTDRHEAEREAPWGVDDAPADFMAGQLKGIVGMRMAISRLQGKWKVSQNRPEADRLGVMAGLVRDADR